MNDPRIITVTIGQREFQRKDFFFFRYGGHNNKLHQRRSKFVFHIMFILEYNLYEYSSTLISVKIMSRRRILTLKLP